MLFGYTRTHAHTHTHTNVLAYVLHTHRSVSMCTLLLMLFPMSPCLSLSWVYMATKHGRRVPESEHTVGGTTLASEPVKQSGVTEDRNNDKDLSSEKNKLITPFRSLQPKLNTIVS